MVRTAGWAFLKLSLQERLSPQERLSLSWVSPFMGQPIYFIMFLLRFQKILEPKATSHKHPEENRGRPTPGLGPPPLGLPARPGPIPRSPPI